MTVYKLDKERLKPLLAHLMESYDVVGPVQRRETTYDVLQNPDEIRLDIMLPLHPAKKFFFAKEETIFEFNGSDVQEVLPKVRPLVLFGLRKCDLDAIHHQDIAFLKQKPADPHYRARREKSVLIGLHCKEGDEYCFCQSLKLPDFYDLMLYDAAPEFYLAETGSEKGVGFARENSDFFEETSLIISEEMREIRNADNLRNTELRGHFKDKDWELGADICFSCGACNFLCPACFCFELRDELSIDMKSGKRVRVPSGCQLKHFTRVAGEHFFRPDRLSRFKHRIYHQMVYFKAVHGVTLCTGCGRCIRGCPVRINWLAIANRLKRG